MLISPELKVFSTFVTIFFALWIDFALFGANGPYMLEDHPKLESNERTTKIIIFRNEEDNSDIVCDYWSFRLDICVD